jgi:hypothetical protein
MCARGAESVLYASVSRQAAATTKGAELYPLAGAFTFIMSALCPFLMKRSNRIADVLGRKMPRFIKYSAAIISRTLSKLIMPGNGFRVYKGSRWLFITQVAFAASVLGVIATTGEWHYVAFGISVGAEPLDHETGCRLNADTLFTIAELAAKHPDIDVLVFNACESLDQTLCTLIRETPNLYAAGYWWHTFFPHSISSMFNRRVDMLPTNKWFGFFSDAYCLDWCYAKSQIVRGLMADALEKRIGSGFIDEEGAYTLVKTLCYDNAVRYYGLK